MPDGHLKRSASTGHLLRTSGGHLSNVCGGCQAGLASSYSVTLITTLDVGANLFPCSQTHFTAVVTFAISQCDWFVTPATANSCLAGHAEGASGQGVVLYSSDRTPAGSYAGLVPSGYWVVGQSTYDGFALYAKVRTGPTDSPVGTYTLYGVYTPSGVSYPGSADATVTVS